MVKKRDRRGNRMTVVRKDRKALKGRREGGREAARAE